MKKGQSRAQVAQKDYKFEMQITLKRAFEEFDNTESLHDESRPISPAQQHSSFLQVIKERDQVSDFFLKIKFLIEC